MCELNQAFEEGLEKKDNKYYLMVDGDRLSIPDAIQIIKMQRKRLNDVCDIIERFKKGLSKITKTTEKLDGLIVNFTAKALMETLGILDEEGDMDFEKAKQKGELFSYEDVFGEDPDKEE